MRRLVVDASVALKWLAPEENSDLAEAVRMKGALWAPELLLAECGNALWKKARRGEVDEDYADLGIRLLERVNVNFQPMRPLLRPALALAQRIGHPIYDCFYLALAIKEECAFVTADTRLLNRVASQDVALDILSLAEAAAL